MMNDRKTLMMEVCDTSLGDILEERLENKFGPLSAGHITLMCANIFKALDYLHSEAHLLHGDIKSFNILIKTDFAQAKLCDFGVSLPLNKLGFVDLVRKPDARYIGTTLWSAPEVLINNNEVNISSKADIFSFGLVIYECIALMPPHTWSMSGKEYDDDNGDEIIDLDGSERTDEDESLDSEALVGTRPPLPEAQELSDEYNVAVELFYVCTNEEPEDRPSAASLSELLNNNKK